MPQTKTLISLISAQTLPNILFAREQGAFDRYILVSTEQMKAKGRDQVLIDTLNLTNAETIWVISDSLEDIQQKLATLEYADDEAFTVNLTGGTKMMAIGVYNFFIRRNSRMYYMAIGKNTVVQVHPEVSKKEQPLNYRTSLKEYLDAYQVQVEAQSWQNKNTLFQPSLLTQKCYQSNNRSGRFRAGWKPLRDREIQRALKNIGYIPLASSGFERIKENLERLDYTTQVPGQLSQQESEYFSGQWLEEYMYFLLKEKLSLSDDNIGLNIKINEDGSRRLQAGNEFDILFVKDNRLYVIECKTGVAGFSVKPFNDYAYKLAALRNFFGLGVKLCLFIQQPTPENKEDFYEKRSSLLNIHTYDGNALNDMDEFIQQLLK